MDQTSQRRVYQITEPDIGRSRSFQWRARPDTVSVPRHQGINVFLCLPTAAGSLLRETPGCTS